MKYTPLLTSIAGSRAYGIHTENSDVDIKGVCLGPVSSYTGFIDRFEQLQSQPDIEDHFFNSCQDSETVLAAHTNGVEGTLYEIRKFFKLAADANPNILDILFSKEEHIVYLDPYGYGRILRDQASDFLSSKAKFTFCGYAFAQLKRIKTHRKWILDPPKEQPQRSDYGLPERTVIPKEDFEAARAAVQKKIDEWELDLDGLDQSRRVHVKASLENALLEMDITSEEKWLRAGRAVGLADNINEIMLAERKYSEAARKYKQYKNWLKSRNPARAALEEAYGYDTKHGSHLYRLLTMGHEILTTGKVNVWRGDIDADQILAIRNGSWSFEKLVGWAEDKDREINRVYERMYKLGKKIPILPAKPNRKKLDELVQQVVIKHIRYSK